MLKDLRSRAGTPEIVMSDTLDTKNVGSFIFTPIGEKVMAKDVRRSRRTA